MGAQVSLHATLELTSELLLLIVAKLPLISIFQLRLVCKKWNAILCDANFCEQYLEVTRLAPLYLWPTEEGYAAYSPESNSWQMLPIWFVLMESCWYKVYGGANGCVLVGTQEASGTEVYLVNPMTRSRKKVCKEINDLEMVGMVFDEYSESYKIFAKQHRQLYCSQPGDPCQPLNRTRLGTFWSLYIYESVLETWTDIGNIGGLGDCPTFFHHGVLHYQVWDGYPQGWKLFHFDGRDSWHESTAARIPYYLRFAHMFEWEGNLVLVGGKVSKAYRHCMSSIKVWQLDEEKNVWMESTSMPSDMRHRFSQFESTSDQRFSVHNNGDHVFLTSYSHSQDSVQQVICNLSETSWWEVPELASSSRCYRPVDHSEFVLKPTFKPETMVAPTKPHTAFSLPDKLFGLMVSKVPIQNRFQLRLVCKAWNATLHDSHFLMKYSQLTTHVPLCFWPTERGFAAYNPETNIWHTWPTSFLIEPSWFKAYRGDFNGFGCGYKILGGGVDGLVLVECLADYKQTLYLANPMTRCHRKLSEVPIWGLDILGMVFDESSRSCKIFGLKREHCQHVNVIGDLSSEEDGCRVCQDTLYLYDLVLDLWEIIGKWGKSMSSYNLPTFYQGILHSVITKFPTSWQPGQRVEVLRFDGGTSWHQLSAPVPQGLVLLHLFEWQGHLMLVGGKGTMVEDEYDNENCLSSVKVWQLDKEKNVWMESTTMPDDLVQHFSPVDLELSFEFFCHSGADNIYFTSSSLPTRWHRGRLVPHPIIVRHVVCNLLTTSWWEIPEGPSIYRRFRRTDFFSFLLKPNYHDHSIRITC